MAATDLVTYTGNAGLGLGANAGIPATGINTNVIDDTNKTLMLLNHENNINKYKQKIADRDKLYTLLDTDQTQSGDIDPIYKPAYEKARKEHDDAFYDMVQNGGIDNTAAYEKYMQTGTTLKNTVTHLQANTLGLKALKTQQAAEPVKAHQEAIQQHIDAQRAKKWEDMVDPYQKTQDYSPADITDQFSVGWGGGSTKSGSSTSNGASSTVTSNAPSATNTTDKKTVTTKDGKKSIKETQTTSAAKEPKGEEQVSGNVYFKPDGTAWSASQQKYNYDKLLTTMVEGYADPTSAEHQNLEANRSIYEAAPDNIAMPVYKSIIHRSADYNNDLGLKPGDEGYKDPNTIAQQLGIDPATGKRIRKEIAMSTPEFGAMMALANYSGSYAPTTETFLKDVGDQSEKVRHDKAMEGVNWEKANAYAKGVNFRISQAKTQEEKQKVNEDAYNRNIIGQTHLITGAGNNRYGLSPIPAAQSTPVFTFDGTKPVLLQPIGAEPIYNKYTDAARTKPATDAKIVGYKGGHYDQQYLFNDPKHLSASRAIDIDGHGGIEDMYQKYEKGMKKKNKPAGGRDNFIKGLIENGVIDVKLIGQNGATDKNLSLSALQAISNADTKKGQESPFGSQDETIPTSESTTESGSSNNGDNSSATQ